MNSLPPRDDGSSPKKSKLPPELDFLRQNPFGNEELDNEEMMAAAGDYLRKLCEHRELIRAHGMDPEAMIALIEPAIRELIIACMQAQKTQDKLIEATADLADAERAMYKQTRMVVELLHAENPFDPKVQEMKEFIEEWSEHMPREEE